MGKGNGALPDEIKSFIVNSLAAFDTPSQVATAVKEEFGREITRQLVQCYDPKVYAGRKLSQKWRTLFETARKQFLEDCTAIPIANRATRLRALQRMAARAEKQGNIGLAARLHEQAAKEVGQAFTNKVDITSAGEKLGLGEVERNTRLAAIFATIEGRVGGNVEPD